MTVPPQYLRSAAAPAPRALVDVLRATAARWPDAAAVDDGRPSQVAVGIELTDSQ